MKWLKRLFLGLLLVLVLLLSAAWGLLGTRQGVEWLVELGDRFIPGELQVQEVEGNLLGKLRLSGIRFENPEMRARVEELVLNWSPRELLHGLFHLDILSLKGVDYSQLRESEEPPAEPLRLPDITLPLRLQLDQVKAESLSLVTAPGAEPLRVDRIELKAGWDSKGVKLDDLALVMPQLDFHGAGRVDPRGGYPLHLNLDWKLKSGELPQVAGKGTLRGDLEKLVLEQKFSGDLGADLKATLSDLLGQLGWDAALTISRLPADYLQIEVPKDLRIDIDSKGNLEKAQAVARLQGTAVPGEKNKGMLLNLVADIGIPEQRFDVKGDWKNLQWPLAGAPQVLVETGNLSVADDYRFTLDAKVEGDQVPEGHWQANGRGSTEQVQLEKLTGETLDGRVEASGQVIWKAGIGWDLQATLTGIDPGRFQPDWPGKLDARLVSKAQTRDGKLHMEAVLEQLQGTLNEKPVSGSGTFRMVGDEITLDRIRVASGSARLDANGTLGRQWDLAWKLEVPDLGDLLPAGEGSIQGSGKLRGTAEKPVVEGALAIRELVYEGTRLAQSDAQFAVGLDEAFDSRVSVTGSDLLVAGQRVESLDLALQGPLVSHRITLDLKHELATLKMAAKGGYRQKENGWEGDLDQLSLVGEKLGNWNLEAPSKLSLSATKVSVTPLCLGDGQAELCIQADRFPDKGNADLELKRLSMERLRPLLPPEIEEFTGVLDAKAHADLRHPMRANLEVVLEPGVLTYLDPESRPIRLEHRNGKLTAVLDEKALDAKWQLDLEEHKAGGELHVPREALDRDPMSAPLTGRIDIAITELGLVRAFVPDIQEIDGNMDVALKLGGTLGNPSLSGHAVLKSDRVLIPRAGLELKDVLVQIQGTDGRTLKLTGQVVSGEDELKLDGVVTLDADKGWPARITLEGENFQLANLPEAQVIVSTDMNLENSKERILLRGKIDVPKALIEIHDLPPGSQDVSPDAVIVGEEESAEQVASAKLDAQVSVTLGDQVHFAGFGLNVDLGGKLTVNMKDGKLPTANGELKILSGSYRAYGQDLTIEKGRISWAGGNINNPNLRLQASRKIDDVTVGVKVAGTARKPSFTVYSSDPDITEKEAISLLLTGQKGTDLSQASIYAGRQITPKLSVGVNLSGGETGTEFVTRYKLLDNVSLEATSSAKKSGGSIHYTLEIE